MPQELNTQLRLPFVWFVRNYLTGRRTLVPNYGGRIIGYGVLGKEAKLLLPLLNGTPLEPTELWDANADGGLFNKPDFESLSLNDIVLIFPLNKVERDTVALIRNRAGLTLFNKEIKSWLAYKACDVLSKNLRGKRL